MSKEENWIVVEVILHGFKSANQPHDNKCWCAKVEYNLTTKKMRPCSDMKERLIYEKKNNLSSSEMFGAPRFHLVSDKSELVVMLGETYSIYLR